MSTTYVHPLAISYIESLYPHVGAINKIDINIDFRYLSIGQDLIITMGMYSTLHGECSTIFFGQLILTFLGNTPLDTVFWYILHSKSANRLLKT